MGSSPTDPELAPYRARLARALADAATEDAGVILDALERAGLGDGLPVLAPTPDTVAALLAGRDPDAFTGGGPLPISFAEPTWGDVASAAALAGCPPAADPLAVIAAALDALADPAFNLLGVQTTTGAAAPLVIVHGAVVDRAGLHAGANALGQGSRRNLALGRAVRLVLCDVGVCRPGEGDMATHGHPGKVSWLVAENQPDSPWPSWSARLGRPADSGVTVFAGVGNVELVLPSTDAAAVADLVARALVGLGCRDAVLLLPPESARFLHRHGWGPDDLGDALVARQAPSPRIIVTGGTGVKATLVPGWGGPTEPVTRWLDDPPSAVPSRRRP